MSLSKLYSPTILLTRLISSFLLHIERGTDPGYSPHYLNHEHQRVLDNALAELTLGP